MICTWKRNLTFTEATPVSSEEFDVTLMACLIRNLSTISIQDHLPSKSDISPGADISRIKYFRNVNAHSDDGKMTTKEFEEVWDDISEVCLLQNMPP